MPHAPRYRRPLASPRRTIPSGRSKIWLRAIATIGIYAAIACAVHVRWLADLVTPPALSIVLAFTVVLAVAIGAALMGLATGKAWTSARERRVERVRPRIRSRLADHLAGRGELDELRECLDRESTVVEEVAVDLLGSISGTELRRLAELLDRSGFVGRWIREYRRADAQTRRTIVGRFARMPPEWGNGLLRAALDDPHEEVRIEAARGLIRSGSPTDVERVFAFATDEPLLVRALLAEDLRPFAMALGEQAVPRLLVSAPPERIEVVLEMIEAWQKSVSIPGLGALLRHPRPGIRARSIRVLPYVVGEIDVEREVVVALEDEHREVRIASAAVAGRLGIDRAVPALAALLGHEDAELTVASARALAEVGPDGWRALEDVARRHDGLAPAAALEALENVHTNRLHLARV